MGDEMSELKENAEKGEHGLAPVTVTMAGVEPGRGDQGEETRCSFH